MSTMARSTQQRSGKNSKVEATATPQSQKSDNNKTESPKALASEKSQPTPEQMRLAGMLESKKDDKVVGDQIKQIMDATQTTESEAYEALHDCDFDLNRAVNHLLEGNDKQNQWSTKEGKKKKNRTSGTITAETPVNHVSGNGEVEEWDSQPGRENKSVATGGRGRDRPRPRGSGPPRLRGRGSGDNRPWKNRENKENERNLEDGFSSDRGRRGGRMSNGPGRGGRGNRGGGRLGSRTFQHRDKSGPGFPRSIDTWNESSGDKQEENWSSNNGASEDWDNDNSYSPKINDTYADGFPSPDEWDNEEYTGSLADSKVFTSSSAPEAVAAEVPDVLETIPPDHNSVEIQAPARPPQLPPSPVTGGTLTPEQTQYLKQLTQQSSSANSYVQQQQQPPVPAQQFTPHSSAPVVYSNNYGPTINNYNSSPPTQPPTVRNKLQKPRVPPPSKIPSTAVEMPPGDAVTNTLLDVQFGGLEFGADSAPLDSSTTVDATNITVTGSPSAASSTPTSGTAPANSMESYVVPVPNNIPPPSSIPPQQKMASGEALLQPQPENNFAATSSPQRPSGTTNSVLTEHPTSKTGDTSTAMTSNGGIYQPPVTYQKVQSVPSVPTPSYTAATTYNNTSYSNPQVTASGSVYSQTAGYTSSNSVSAGTYAAANNTTAVNSYPSTGGYTANHTSYTSYATFPGNNYQNTQPAYPPQTAMTYQGYQNSSYQQNIAAPAVQQNHKMAAASLGASQTKDAQYETGQVTANSISTVSTVNSTPSLGLSATSQSVAASKVTPLPTANKSGMVAGIPTQVPPIMNTPYIMGQTAAGVSYFPQQMFYDDTIMLQQRLPPTHMAAGYFDLGFQQQAATGRDVTYSMSDARFARADNNASPVPSTLSQQTVTQGHTPPMLNPTALPPGYAYFYSGFPNIQYSAPAIYSQMPPTATAGNSTSGQYKAGPAYGSAPGYSSGYETGADAYKVANAGGYAGTPAQTKAGGAPTTSTDLAPIYTKGHAALNKVNSYDKTGFHTATAPPYNMTSNQSGLAPSATYPQHLFISTMPPHQQHAHTAATLMHSHQPLHQDGANTAGPRSQTTSQANKAGTKQQNYSPSFWANSS